MTVYRIRSKELRAKGEKFESADKRSAERKLITIQNTLDPHAKLLTIPAGK